MKVTSIDQIIVGKTYIRSPQKSEILLISIHRIITRKDYHTVFYNILERLKGEAFVDTTTESFNFPLAHGSTLEFTDKTLLELELEEVIEGD